MAINRRKFNSDPATGFGTSGLTTGDRLYRKDGTVNVIRTGVSFFDSMSWYHTMLSMPRWKFWLVLFSIYIAINILFATIYIAVGIEHLGGLEAGTAGEDFVEAFFFSAQTYTTVGYGRVSPIGVLTSAIASFEAFMGVLSFALASGLFYGRFSRPKAYLFFSEMALLSPYKGGKGLMFRVVPYKNNQLTEAEVKLTLSLRVRDGDTIKNQFFPLQAELNKINSLVLNWTVVHAITEESPLTGLSLQDLKDAKAEILVLLKAFDDVFSNSVIARTSYASTEIVDNARFVPMYHPAQGKGATVLRVDLLNEYEVVPQP